MIFAFFINRLDGLLKVIKKYLEAFGDKECYATSHVGWGLNRSARYEALTMYDKNDLNGTELRTLAGSFLYSTGANEFANRFTEGHFDLPMMNCTINIDGRWSMPEFDTDQNTVRLTIAGMEEIWKNGKSFFSTQYIWPD